MGRSPDAPLLRRLGPTVGDATPLGLVHAALGGGGPPAPRRTASGGNISTSFIGLGRGELLPYASYYLTGFLHERPLARLRADLKRLGIEAAPGQSEPEDHAAILCEIMAALVGRDLGPAGADKRHFCKALGALDRSLLQRSGALGNSRFLRPRRRRLAELYGHRNRSLWASGLKHAVRRRRRHS